MALTKWAGSSVFWWSFFAAFGRVAAFNIYEEQVDVFKGDDKSLFGYSVLQHENSAGKWLLVGAPKSLSLHQPLLKTPGALFKCHINDRNHSCQQVPLDTIGNEETSISGVNVREIKEDQWLGVSLDSYQESPGLGNIVVCGHRWINNYYGYYDETYGYPEGICYTINSQLEATSVQKLRPCLTGLGGVAVEHEEYHGFCQVGTSAHYTNDGTLLLGAPGANGWYGVVISTVKPKPEIADWSVMSSAKASHGYGGYSLTSGSFTSSTAKEGVTGAPRANELGKVFIFDLINNVVKKELYGEPMNTYFGSSLAAVDLNNDGLSDLLVGAPLFTDKMDEGRVYVYINRGEGNLQLKDKLRGNNAIGARFGAAMAVVGDINKDGYQDVAIGAPLEDDNSGAVYLYHGSILGLKQHYSQRLAGKSVNTGVKSFGSSLSGGIDMDDNGYPDVVVGAHQNATIVFYKSQSVISVEQTLQLTPEILSPNVPNITICSSQGLPITCVHMKLCLRYTGYRVPEKRVFTYTIASDVLRTKRSLPSRFYFVGQGQVSVASHVKERIVLQLDQENCTEHTAYLNKDARDFLNTVPFQSTYGLHVNSILDPTSGLPLVLNAEHSQNITKEIAFLRNCGTDEICETDMKVVCHLETSRGIKFIYLGAETKLNANIEVTNNGEEAHQAYLTVMFPRDVGYIGVESIDGRIQCNPQENGDSLQCWLGNPMECNNKVQFTLRFDASSLLPSRERLNWTITAHTSSFESNDTLHDNMVEPDIPVLVLADLVIRGASLPEQVVYTKDESDSYLDDVNRVLQELERHKAIGSHTQDISNVHDLGEIASVSNRVSKADDKVDIDESVIGPSLVFNYEIINLGPSSIPFSSFVNITIPWRMKNGDWLIYLKGLRDTSGVEACNIRKILREQSLNIKKQYQWDDSVRSAKVDSDDNLLKYESGLLELDCNNTSCVTVTCHIRPLHVSESVVIELQTLIWKYSFLKHDIGVSAVFSEASVLVDNSSQRFSQPENHQPDAIKVVVRITSELIVLKKPIPLWIIITSVTGGIASLVVIILIMTKFGFFRRTSKEQMRKLIDEKAEKINRRQ